MDLEKSLRQAMETGKVELGMDSTMKATKTGRARLVIVSSKFPAEARSDLRHYAALSRVPVFEFLGNSTDLGRVCRKPFQVASLAVIDPGASNILSAVKGA